MTTDQRIDLPRPDATVTSPVRVWANLPGDSFTWVVLDAAGEQVGSSGFGGRGGFSGPGSSWRRAATRSVRGSAAPGSPTSSSTR